MGESGVLNDSPTDLSPIMSTFMSANGYRYHLHPELVKNGEVEVIFLCVDCLQLVNEEKEDDAGTIDPESTNAEVKIEKRNISRKKLREKSMAIAAGCDYGVLSRIKELPRPSVLERALLCPHRAYYVTVKVKNPVGLPGSKSLQGDIICFTQDGPAEALELLGSMGETMHDRIEWVRGGGNFKVILVDDQGNMENWLHDNAVLVARPHVVFNELRVRAKIDEATETASGLPCPQDATYQDDFVKPLEGLAGEMFKQSRRLEEKHIVAVEAFSELQASDVAGVRQSDNGGDMDSVGVMSSNADVPSREDHDIENIAALLELMEDDDEFGACEEPGDAESVGADVGPGTDPVVARRRSRFLSSKLRRGNDAVNEFENNGLNVMTLFRHIFPLMWSKAVHEGTSKLKQSNDTLVYGPLKAKGTLSQKQRTHIMMQFTTLAARDPMIHHFLANQTRRHSTCITVSRLPAELTSSFEKLVNADDFAERCENARHHPTSPDAKRLSRTITRFVRSAGKTKPWSAQERENIKPTLLAMKDRHGTGSVFYTISLDDVHNILTIRICFPTKQLEGFPSFAGDDDEMEAEHIEKMMEALRNGGVFNVNGTGNVRFEESQLQRLVVTNPTACSIAYHRMIEQVHSVLFGRDCSTKKTVQIFHEVDGELCLTEEALRKGIKPGILGLNLGFTEVTETSSRKALHCHGIGWTAASPEFLASIAANEEVWSDCAAALETQISGEVGLEVWLLGKLMKTVKVKKPRASFASVAPIVEDAAAILSQEARAVREGVTAVGLQEHGCTFTCKKGFGGKWGCRFCNPAGHPVDKLMFVQLNAADRVDEGAVLAGDKGQPVWCESVQQSSREADCATTWCSTKTCTAQWLGFDDRDDDGGLLNVILTRPSPMPAFVSNKVK